jgi:hypothetical protein
MADLESSRAGAALLAVGFGFKGSGSRDVVLRRAVLSEPIPVGRTESFGAPDLQTRGAPTRRINGEIR